ncbi:MAG: hypothetical protein ACRC1L_05285, partial [Prochlorococcaceae cyanobacterium]
MGLRYLAAGGDCANDLIAITGGALGEVRLVTVDQKAAMLLQDSGQTVVVLSAATPATNAGMNRSA